VGKVFSSSELRRLGDFCKAHDLLLLSDEIYHDLILEPKRTPHVPISALEDPELLRCVTWAYISCAHTIKGTLGEEN
jgi:cystathionine beta-lyase